MLPILVSVTTNLAEEGGGWDTIADSGEPYGTLRAGDIEGSDVEPTTLRADDFEGRRL